jgi:signal transduction histidine kinase
MQCKGCPGVRIIHRQVVIFVDTGEMSEASIRIQSKSVLITDAYLNEQIQTGLQDRYINPIAVSARFRDLILQVTSQNTSVAYSSIGNLWLAQGDLQFQAGDYDHALESFSHAADMFGVEKDLNASAACLAWRAQIEIIQSAYASALHHTIQGLEMALAMHNRGVTGRQLANLGNIYHERGEHMRALGNILRAANELQGGADIRALVSVNETVCRIYTVLKNPSLALNAGLQGLKISREHGLKAQEAQLLCSLADAYGTVGEFAHAKDCLDDARLMVGKIRLPYETSRMWLSLGRLYQTQNMGEMAADAFTHALKQAEQIQARGVQIQVHQLLADVYRQMDQYQNALAHYEHYHELKQQIFTEDAETRIQNLEVVYQVDSVKREAEEEQNKVVSLQQEIEERARMQHDLEEANEKLQHEVAVREQLIGDLNSFAHMVAHDLKTPLQSMAILTHLLQMQLEGMSANTEALSLVEQLQQTYQKSNSIIQELLTLASLRSQNIQMVPLDMGAIINEALKRVNFMVTERQAEIQLPAEWPRVVGHAPWMEEVWANYLSNAIKYGGYPPVVQLGAFHLDNHFVRFWIQDNGDGIKPEEQVRLFNDFSQLEGRRKVDGHGLGLSIVRRIIEKMGGNVGVESRGRSGEGSRFWFTLPDA